MRQALNRVKIEGILAEKELKVATYTNSNGEEVEYIGGQIKVLVEQNINGEDKEFVVPVHMFSNKYTKAGQPNKVYESIKKVYDDFNSIASTGDKEQADKVRITGAYIKMNEFIGREGNIVSEPRIHANFVSKAIGQFVPEATFSVEFMVSQFSRATDKDGVELDPPQLKIQTVIPQYTSPNATAPNVDVVTFCAYDQSVINPIESYWEPRKTYKANGYLNFTSITEQYEEPVDFGAPIKRLRTISKHDLVITAGTQEPMDDDMGFDVNEIQEGLTARKARLEEKKVKNVSKSTPAQPKNNTPFDLGF